ncbi:hypothetical protein HBB16_19505 [Pseudonocardia sp. MCCB 268]|nr:hypothetical protein [Pseudonocardia cytotoxica]
MNPDHLRAADAIEVVLGQAPSPAAAGCCFGQKISERVAEMWTLLAGDDQRSACRHPTDRADDLAIKIHKLRRSPTGEAGLRQGRRHADLLRRRFPRSRPGPVSSLSDGDGGTAATQEVFIEHVGILILPRSRRPCRRCRSWGCIVQLIVSGGSVRVPTAKAMARWARTRSVIGTGALIALGGQRPTAGRRVRGDRVGRGLLRRLPGRSRPGRHLHPGPGARGPGSTRSRGAAGGSRTTCGARPSRRRRWARLRQGSIPAPGAGGSRGVSRWSPRDGAGSAGRGRPGFGSG